MSLLCLQPCHHFEDFKKWSKSLYMVSSGKCTSVAYQTCRPIGYVILMVQLHVSSVVLLLVSPPSGDQCIQSVCGACHTLWLCVVQVLSPCSTSKLHVHSCFLCQSALTLSEQKLIRKWAWLDSRITAITLAMPGPVAVCILEPEKPTGLEIRYVMAWRLKCEYMCIYLRSCGATLECKDEHICMV